MEEWQVGVFILSGIFILWYIFKLQSDIISRKNWIDHLEQGLRTGSWEHSNEKPWREQEQNTWQEIVWNVVICFVGFITFIVIGIVNQMPVWILSGIVIVAYILKLHKNIKWLKAQEDSLQFDVWNGGG